MNPDKEKQLNELSRKLAELNKTIIKDRLEKGAEGSELRAAFIKTEEEIQTILCHSAPLDEIRNPDVRDILRKVRDRDYFELDKEMVKLEKLVKTHPDIVTSILQSKGIEVTDAEIDKRIDDIYIEFQGEIEGRIDPSEYFDRKEKFGNLIVNTRLPKKIHIYYAHVKECFLFGQMFAVVGLCRVLLELAFKDRHQKLGLSKSSQNVQHMDDYKIATIIREVCSRLHVNSGEARELYYDISSQILHGREPKIIMTSEEVLSFVQRVFRLIEKLYAR